MCQHHLSKKPRTTRRRAFALLGALAATALVRAAAARDLAPDRIVPFLAEGYANALHPDSSYVHPAGLDELFGANVIRGLGEVICRHSAFQLGASGGFYS